MNKILPRPVRDFQFETRHVAREAARRQHKSLDTWLQDVVTDYAAELGVDEDELDRQQRIDAVALMLEGLSASDDDHRTAGDTYGARQNDLQPEDAELILEDAITVMQRRLSPDGRSLAGARHGGSERRDRQGSRRGPMRTSASRFHPFEAQAGRDAGHPAESRMPADEEMDAWNPPENTYWKFGNKLNAILDAVQAKAVPEAAPTATTASDRRLGPAIADVRKRQQVLDHTGRAPQTAIDDHQRESTKQMEARVSAAFVALQKKITAQEMTIDGLSRDVVGQREARSKLASDLTTLCTEISGTLRKLRSRNGESGTAQADETSSDTVAATAPEASNANESPPRSPKSDAGADAFLDLQRQVEALSKQFERSQGSVAKLASIEGSVRSLFALQSAARTRQGEVESRTTLTFNAVHEAMGKIVERLSSMDKEKIEVRNRPQPTPPQAPKAAGAGDSRSDLARDVAKAFAEKLEAPSSESGPPPAVAPSRRPFPTRPVMVEVASSSAARSAILERSRAYVARQAKPIMAASGALLFVAGAAAAVYPSGVSWHSIDTAGDIVPSHIAGTSGVVHSRMQQADHQPSHALVSTLTADPVQTGTSAGYASFVATPKVRQSATFARLKALAEAGNGAAQYELGVQYSDTDIAPRDFALAAQWFQKAADQGITPAQYRLGSLYEKGLGVPRDLKLAKSLYLKAAESGHPRAMHNLAVLLVDGNGNPDYEGAATWFRKAAQFGVRDSQYNLGILLGGGLGVSQSLVQSYAWFTIAAAQNDVDAAKKRDEVGRKLNADDLATAKAWAASFQTRAPIVAAVQVRLPSGDETAVAKLVP